MPMPTIEKEKFRFRHIIYIFIVLVCMIAIGIAVYNEYFKDEKLGVIFGITKQEEDEEITNLKENFLNLNIFSNDINVLDNYNGNIKKIRENEDIILLANEIKQQNKNYTLDVEIPYFNVDSVEARKINNEIKTTFFDKSESILKSSLDSGIVYNVRFKAYLYNNIVSLVILSELKEETSNQRIIIQTYNYNLNEDKQVTIDELIDLKNIDINSANSIIKEEVRLSQQQNIKLQEMGYNANIRDFDSDMYKINNAEQFFIGEKGYLYIVYPYGNTEMTSEMNLIILK